MNPCFGSGPCAKRTGWKSPNCHLVGRSHRSAKGLKLIQETIQLQRSILHIPEDYLIGIADGSCTGVMEMLIWNLVGARPVDVLAHCVFSNHWAHDIADEMKVAPVNLIKAPFPTMSDVNRVDFSHDVVFCMSSTTSGVAFRDTNWIPQNREGLTLCDAASAAFAIDLDWSKLDAVAFSWQKGLGGEGGFGTIVLSPKAVQRLESFRPNRAIPRIFRIVNDGKLNYALFNGNTINTPSLLCIEEFYENLKWVDDNGGMSFLTGKVEANYQTVKSWVSSQNLFKFLVEEKFRAHHIACLDINDEWYQSKSKDEKWDFLRKIVKNAEEKNWGYDFLGHILTEPHLRIWCGPTVDAENLQEFLPHLIELYQDAKQHNDTD